METMLERNGILKNLHPSISNWLEIKTNIHFLKIQSTKISRFSTLYTII